MKAVILAGGRGTRIAEESHLRPKPMIEVGGRPILWHIMRYYAHWGVRDFVVCLGYRGYVIKEYFANYFLHASDVTIDLESGALSYLRNRSAPWRVTLIDTGEDTMTGGRLRRVRSFVEDDGTFLLTYGDGLANIDIDSQLAFHRGHGLLATMTVVRPPARFGTAQIDGIRVTGFEEKAQASAGFINGGFFVLEPGVIDYIDGDATPLETTPLERLTSGTCDRRTGCRCQCAAWRP